MSRSALKQPKAAGSGRGQSLQPLARQADQLAGLVFGWVVGWWVVDGGVGGREAGREAGGWVVDVEVWGSWGRIAGMWR